MSSAIENVIEEEALEQVVKLSPLRRFWGLIKKVLIFVVTLKWTLEILKRLGKFIIAFFKITMKSVNKLTDPQTWDVVLFVGCLWLIIGFIAGIILQVNYDILNTVKEWIQYVQSFNT